MADWAIKAENISKSFRLGAETKPYNYELLSERLSNAVKGMFLPPKQQQSDRLFWALDDVSFTVEPGKIVGVIGGNGSGKSTLLKVLSRVTPPTKGRAEIKGRLSSLLELNAGFHAELAGRENIYLLGTILGLKKREIDQQFDQIVEFADVAKFLDTPVKHYSSGMVLRLGFAVAAHLQPDILLLDEVLAVGDAAFQRKCMGRVAAVSQSGRTILFVSHQLEQIRQLCDSCLFLNRGKLIVFDKVDDAIEQYITALGLGDESTIYEEAEELDLPMQVRRVIISDLDGQQRKRFDYWDVVVLEVHYSVRLPVEQVYLEVVLNSDGSPFFWTWDIDTAPERLNSRNPGDYLAKVPFPKSFLKPGHYTVSINVCTMGTGRISQHREHVVGFEVVYLTGIQDEVSFGSTHGHIGVPIDWNTVAGTVPEKSVDVKGELDR